jgi:hypothetical protein
MSKRILHCEFGQAGMYVPLLTPSLACHQVSRAVHTKDADLHLILY